MSPISYFVNFGICTKTRNDMLNFAQPAYRFCRTRYLGKLQSETTANKEGMLSTSISMLNVTGTKVVRQLLGVAACLLYSFTLKGHANVVNNSFSFVLCKLAGL